MKYKYKISDLFFGSILLFVIITSGCVEYKDGTLSIKFQNITEVIPEIKVPELISGINIQIKNVDYAECKHDYLGGQESCIKVKIGFKNNKEELVSGSINHAALVTSNGKQIGTIGDINDHTDWLYLGGYYLFPNAQSIVTINFPIIYKKDNPILYLNIIDNTNKENPEKKEYKFNLTPYLNS